MSSLWPIAVMLLLRLLMLWAVSLLAGLLH
jgi:hypothetical protein